MKKYHPLSALLLGLALSLELALPALAAEGPAAEPFSVNATAAILIDDDHDVVLYEYNADEKRYPASITKVMTGLLTVEAVDRGELSMGQSVTLTDELYTGIGADGSTQGLLPGEILTVKDLLYCALLPSANEACNALAIAVAGDIPTFVERMNQRSQELGMTNTHFVNTHGYHDEGHYTTARDIAKMCQAAMEHPDFREIVSSKNYTVAPTNMKGARELLDTNGLLTAMRTGRSDLLYPYATGIKTGSTPEAGHCLASSATKDDRTMIAVLLGGESVTASADKNYFAESKRLLEHGFNDFSYREILSAVDPLGTVPVTLCAEQDYVTVQPAQALEATLANSVDPAQFQREVDLPESLEAPIAKGQVLGSVTVSYEGETYGTVDLVATSALERSEFLYFKQRALDFLDQLWVKIALAVLALVIAFLIFRRAFGGGRRRGGGSSRRYTSSSYRGRRR